MTKTDPNIYNYIEFDEHEAWLVVPENHPDFRNTHDPTFWENGGQARQYNHQYGCISCRQAAWMGRIEPLPPHIAHKIATINDCDSPMKSDEVISALADLGFSAKHVDEGLIELTDGRFIVHNNCD